MNKQDIERDLTPEVKEKMKKNLVYIGIFSVIMLFAGLSSAYIVSMGDSFWVKYNFPSDFYLSTILILLSSIVLIIGIKQAQKKQDPKILKIAVPLTFVLGVLFALFQIKGYKQLVEKGAYFNSKIMVSNGRYGSFFELKIQDQFMEIDGSDYLLNGKIMTPEQKKEVSSFASELLKLDYNNNQPVPSYGKYTLLYKQQAVTLKNNLLFIQDTIPLGPVDYTRLHEFAVHLKDGRGDFFHTGKMGTDYHIYYKGKELSYKNRSLYYNGRVLSAPLQLKIENAADTASTYLYFITFLHLLHILVTLLFMFSFAIRSFTGDLTPNNYLSIRVAGIFWHFLGVLWVYLLLFLLFIH